jgi:signal transduction histidine kinase
MDMTEGQKKYPMPYFKVLRDLAIIIILSFVVYVIAGRMNLAESAFQYFQKNETVQLDELFIVAIFLVVSLAIFAVRLWKELKHSTQECKSIENALETANTKLLLLNSITRQDVLNELTEISGELDRTEQRPLITKVKATINRIRRQIKFIKEYQDIGVNKPEWQNVADTITRARVGVDLGKVALDIDVRNVEIYADRLLEKVMYYMIDNALQHGGEKLTRIRFYDRMAENDFVLICEDDGVGIPFDKKGLLFPKEYGHHTGYGLMLVKETLGVTGISIKEVGVLGKGAKFEIRIPKGAYRHI